MSKAGADAPQTLLSEAAHWTRVEPDDDPVAEAAAPEDDAAGSDCAARRRCSSSCCFCFFSTASRWRNRRCTVRNNSSVDRNGFGLPGAGTDSGTGPDDDADDGTAAADVVSGS